MTVVPQRTMAVIEYIYKEDGGEFILDVKANGELWAQYRFDTASERQRFHDDMLDVMRQLGAKDLPPRAM